MSPVNKKSSTSAPQKKVTASEPGTKRAETDKPKSARVVKKPTVLKKEDRAGPSKAPWTNKIVGKGNSPQDSKRANEAGTTATDKNAGDQ